MESTPVAGVGGEGGEGGEGREEGLVTWVGGYHGCHTRLNTGGVSIVTGLRSRRQCAMLPPQITHFYK